MGFSRQEYWSGLPFPPPGDLHDPGMEPTSPAGQAAFFLTAEPPEKPQAHTLGDILARFPADLRHLPLLPLPVWSRADRLQRDAGKSRA